MKLTKQQKATLKLLRAMVVELDKKETGLFKAALKTLGLTDSEKNLFMIAKINDYLHNQGASLKDIEKAISK